MVAYVFEQHAVPKRRKGAAMNAVIRRALESLSFIRGGGVFIRTEISGLGVLLTLGGYQRVKTDAILFLPARAPKFPHHLRTPRWHL